MDEAAVAEIWPYAIAAVETSAPLSALLSEDAVDGAEPAAAADAPWADREALLACPAVHRAGSDLLGSHEPEVLAVLLQPVRSSETSSVNVLE